MSKIELTQIGKFYGKNHVLKDLNLTIEDGDFMTLLGPSGCGKTTTLRVVSGLEKPQSGFIHMDGKEIVNAFREDEVRPSMATETALANAPKRVGDEFLLPKIVEGAES